MQRQFFLRLFIVLTVIMLSPSVYSQRFKQILSNNNADGRLEVFLLDQEGEVFHKYQLSPNGGWSDWSSLGGTYIQSIFVETNRDGRLELFALEGDETISHKWQEAANGGWTKWSPFGGNKLKQLFAAKNADGGLELFSLGGDNTIYHKWQIAPNGVWGEWASLGGTNLKNLFVVSNADGRLELFVLGGDNAIWHKFQLTPNGGWGEWASLGGNELKQLFVSANADGRLELFALGGDNAIWHKWQTTPNGGWGEWASLGGMQLQDFAVGKNADGRMELFTLAADNVEWQKCQTSPNGGWGDWSNNLIPTLNNNTELAFHYAPIHYQDTDNDNFKADYITSVDYDNNWNTIDNWDNLDNYSLPATVYYSIVETCTHWYIIYAFYHPRDWDEYATSEHENDLEGIIAMVRKDGTLYGKIEGAITIAHVDFYSYVPRGSSLSNGGEDIDGTLYFSEFEGSAHPMTSQESKGHGFKAYPYIEDFSGKNDEDGIIYYPSRTTAQVPTSGNDRHVLYKLVDIFSPGGLWDHQLSDIDLPRSDASVFATFGNFKGDGSGSCGDGGGGAAWCDTDGANAPWNWDGNGTDSHKGDFALDPANLFQKFYSGLGEFDNRYISNKYLSDLMKKGYTSDNKPQGWNEAIDINAVFSKLINNCQ